MTAKAKKREIIENVAEKFLLLSESDKSFIAGYLAGKEEECAKWKQIMVHGMQGSVSSIIQGSANHE
ncbi:MAG: hypothetical protein K2N51_08755 [Lachnospiraceae bacterium]|nr:hypothetical protein [Lachnospiraceae bacterium]